MPVNTLNQRHVVGGTTAPVSRMKGVLYLPENHTHWSCFVSESKRKVLRYLCGEVLKRVTYCGHIKSCAFAVVLIHFALRVRAMKVQPVSPGWCLWPPLPATLYEHRMGEGKLNAALCELQINRLRNTGLPMNFDLNEFFTDTLLHRDICIYHVLWH